MIWLMWLAGFVSGAVAVVIVLHCYDIHYDDLVAVRYALRKPSPWDDVDGP